MHKEKIDKHILLIVAGGPMMIGNPKRGSIFMYNQGVTLSKYYNKVGIISTGFVKSNIGCIFISGIFKSGIPIKVALQGKLF